MAGNPPKVPSWYLEPTGSGARGKYDEKVGELVAEAQSRADKETFVRADNLIALDKLRGENAEASRKAHIESEDKQFSAMVESLRASAIAGIERGRDTAKYVQTASVAAAGLYTGLLGFVFGFASGAQELPLRAAIPTVFFGLAVAFSTWYLAYLPDGSHSRRPPMPSSLPRENTLRNLNFVIGWVNDVIAARAWALRAASVFLILAVMFLPAAFISAPKLPNLVGAGGTAAAADAAEPAWPSPPSIAEPKLALELYRRQLDRFEKDLNGTPEAPSRVWDWMLIVGAAVVAWVAFRRVRRGGSSGGSGGTSTDTGTVSGGIGVVITRAGPF